MNYGEILQFKARFYSLKNNTNLINYIITVKIVSKSKTLYIKNFTTNSSGIIEVLIPPFENLTIGTNYLMFEIKGNNFFESSTFEYELFIETQLEEESDSKDSQSEIKNENSFVMISLISMLSISFLALFSIKYIIIKKPKEL